MRNDADWKKAAAALAPAACVVAGLAIAHLVTPTIAAILLASLAIAALLWMRHGVVAVAPPTPQSPAEDQPYAFGVIDGLPDPVIVVNAAREVIAVNQPAHDLLGIDWLGRDLALSVRHPQILTAVDRAFDADEPVSVDVTLPSTPSRTINVVVSPLPAGGRAAPRLVLSFRDETPARRIEQTHADFVANASHELRSPLASLIGFIETLRGPASGDAAARERFLAIMHNEAMRMARLIDDLMSLSRVEMNEHVPPKDRVDLSELLIGVVDALTGRADAKTMTLALDCPADAPPVIGDADQLIQVFHNLVDNAIKYGRPATTISIAVRAGERLSGGDGGAVSIAIADRGDGIEAIHLPRLTERFYRVDTGRSRRMGGTGLGLAIVKHIVNRHRGRLAIDSEVGVGTTFTLTLRTAGATPVRSAANAVSPPPS